MSPELSKNLDDSSQNPLEERTIRVALLAEEPLGWGSGKHFFPIILHQYTWKSKTASYKILVENIFDADILQGRLTTTKFDVLLVPGGGVGDAHAVMKGFRFSRRAQRWKKNISTFIQNGGGYIGICGGTALITDLITEDKKPSTFLERQYHKSSLGVSCVSSYYRSIAFPLFYLLQKKYPEKIGAIAYVFAFAPGETTDGIRIHTGGTPLDFQLEKNHPIFSDYPSDTERIRWYGGPALLVPEHPDRDVKILARYPTEELSDNPTLRLHAWRYTGGFRGLVNAFFNTAQLIKKNHDSLKNLFLYTYFLAGNWEITNRIIQLNYSNKASITAEIYPNQKKGRILLCSAHPEYMIWWNGRITERSTTNRISLGTGLYKWTGITPLSPNAIEELTHTWWMVRRFVAWAAKVPDDQLPPIKREETDKDIESLLETNVFWDGSLLNQIKNI
jgi:glutamine amidotransferase-like uncharacterized protein